MSQQHVSPKASGTSESLSFSLFNGFPREIRIMIWEFALPAPGERVVRIREAKLRAPSLEDGIQSFALPPSLLFVNKESHSIASKFYKRMFHWPEYDDPCYGVYLSPQLDTLYLRYREYFFRARKEEEGRYGTFLSLAREFHHYYHAKEAKVQNLAILIDRNAVHELDFDENNPEHLTEVWDHDYIEDLEGALDFFLTGFQWVKHLTIVIKDVTPVSESTQISYLVNPIDIKKAFRKLKQAGFLDMSADERRNFTMADIPMLKPKRAKVHLQELERYRECETETPWEMPEVVYKIAVTADQKKFVDWLTNTCEDRASWEDTMCDWMSLSGL